MKFLATLLLLQFLAACSTSSRHYALSNKSTAEGKATITISLDGVFTEEKEVLYVRTRLNEPLEYFQPQCSSRNADGVTSHGKGVGYGLYVIAKSEEEVIQIELSAFWTLEMDSGHASETILVPYLRDVSSRKGRFIYSVRWEKMRPNQ
jgi:hypothetical protein